MTYGDYEEIYNHFLELEQRDKYLLDRLNAHEWFPVITYVLCGITLIVIVCFFVWFLILLHRQEHDC